MMLQSKAVTLILLGFLWAIAACASNSEKYEQLAEYLHSPGGYAEWQRTEEQLAKATEAAADEYRAARSMEALRRYEKAILEYLDHGFMLYQALIDSPYDLPQGLRRSLERRTAELMDVADGYLAEGSIPVAVAISREVILKYNVGIMDHAQYRAEGILLEYRYRRN